MKITATTALMVIAIIALAAIVTGYIANPFAPSTPAAVTPWSPNAPTQPAGQTYAGILYLEVVDSVLGAGVTTSTVTVDVVAAANGQFDFISGAKDTKAQAANPQAMNSIWAEGTELILMADCTGNPSGGLDYYPAMYYVKLADGATVYELTSLSCFQQSGSKYTINPAAGAPTPYRVSKYQASNVNYWNLGKLMIYPRGAVTDLDLYVTYNGVTLSSLTDGASFDDTDTEVNANATLASTVETISLSMVGGVANHGWGKHFYVVNSLGTVDEYGGVLIVSTKMTSIAIPSGWTGISMSTLYAEKAFYKDISETEGMFPTKGNKAGWTIPIRVDCTAAATATAYRFSFTLNDCQNIKNVGSTGTSTSVPTAYGFVTAYGPGSVNLVAAFASNSSGLATGQMLMTYLTTPS